jgi:WD40 repeat protein
LCGGELADRRQVLLMGGEGISLWDLTAGEIHDLRIPVDYAPVRSIALSVVGGRDCVTVMDQRRVITTFDLSTGALKGTSITAHAIRRPDGLMVAWPGSSPHPTMAVVGSTLAVPTRWRVHLWNLGTSLREVPAITGPATGSMVQAVRWQSRNLLLTGSTDAGIAAIWDVDVPVARALGHDERVCRLALAEPADVVVSADEGGTITARSSTDGRLVFPPLITGVESTRALTAWCDGSDIIAAQGAGSHYVSDSKLRRWNVTTGERYGPAIDAHLAYVHWLSRVDTPDGPALVTFGPGGILKVWRPLDGSLVAQARTEVKSKVTGFATGVVDGTTIAVLTSYSQPMTVYDLDELTAPPVVIPEAVNDAVLDVVDSHVVAARVHGKRRKPTDTVRAWNMSGRRVGMEVRGEAEVTAAVGRAWPAVYIGRADGTVSLTDLETGRDLCAPVLLPTSPSAMIATRDRDLIVGFGSDLARIRPPGRLRPSTTRGLP